MIKVKAIIVRTLRSKIIGNKGQTAVEYILMFSVIAALCFSLTLKLKNFLIGNGDCSEGNDSYFCKIINKITGEGSLGGKFQRFRLRK
ncbi:MAG: hypothetical protein HQK49_11930 [Oligoflexia bacterium]|nr:hypothetical protein [Oligoflexia bacterium]